MNRIPYRQSAGKLDIIKAMPLTQVQQQILTGLLLGDGYLERKSKNSRLQVKQSVNKKEYVFWLYDQFREFVKTPPKQRPDTDQWYFSTRSLPQFEYWKGIFYKDRTKIVPTNITELLYSPMALAVWFMDDGSLDYREKSHYSFTYSTDSFSVQEVSLLQRALLENFGIESTIQTPKSRGKKYTKLYIGKNGRERFIKIILPHILNCFAYKVPPHHILTPQRLILRESPKIFNTVR
jgi:hypothetical protein